MREDPRVFGVQGRSGRQSGSAVFISDLATELKISFSKLHEWIRHGARELIQRALLIGILAMPSLYLLLKFPPLWRDSDGFFQVYERFNHITILHWPPLYCFSARIPILFGQVTTSLAVGHGWPGFHFAPPQFTNLGIYLLVITQHSILIGTLFLICIMLTQSFFVRVLISLLFILNPAI